MCSGKKAGVQKHNIKPAVLHNTASSCSGAQNFQTRGPCLASWSNLSKSTELEKELQCVETSEDYVNDYERVTKPLSILFCRFSGLKLKVKESIQTFVSSHALCTIQLQLTMKCNYFLNESVMQMNMFTFVLLSC